MPRVGTAAPGGIHGTVASKSPFWVSNPRGPFSLFYLPSQRQGSFLEAQCQHQDLVSVRSLRLSNDQIDWAAGNRVVFQTLLGR